ncbi:related to Cell cycle control protein cwf25 [Sporisorium reilianum SRZ2]|uniref:Related to Cell cycle control protein cwf25 n=1 Tax=Sporisorium reilianum (strain SRZ2) TaxID=999809 RepID=E6ZNL2_SPORE|nr:related to Cell cycle control protein cwf25 [Sporisorium reilianum SRZ2]
MGGGDLNMKKSWHPLLQVNQERVWKREKEALEESKKLEELRREREQEREMQELQRLQEEAGGKKRVDRVDWMYATPATTGSNSAAEMEDYLLGKKRVDKLLQADENKDVSKSSNKSLISLQNANSARDLAAKVREDPMLAIKQQEQAAYEALLRDPARLRQLKMQAGIDVDGKSKEERRRRKEEKRRRHEEDGHRRHESRRGDSRSDSRSYRHRDDRGYSDRTSSRTEEKSLRRRHGDDESRSSKRRRDDDRRDRPSERRHRDADESRPAHRSNGDRRDRAEIDDSRSRPRRSRSRSRSRSPPARDSYRPSNRDRPSTYTRPPSNGSTRNPEQDDKRKEEIRQQRLREMEHNAKSMEEQRTSYVSKINAEEAEQERKEAELRQKLLDARSKGHGDGRGGFIMDQQRKTFGDTVDLAERMRRDRGRLQQQMD